MKASIKTSSRRTNKLIIFTIILCVLIVITTLLIIFLPPGIAVYLLDYSVVIGGIFLVVEASIMIYLHRREAFVFHITRILRIMIGLAMIVIHLLRILPVPTMELL